LLIYCFIVVQADAATVFADAIGGSGTATGYFLIYVETDTLKAIQEAFLPDAETDGQYLSTKTIKVELLQLCSSLCACTRLHYCLVGCLTVRLRAG
jgi:hypothetical protein